MLVICTSYSLKAEEFSGLVCEQDMSKQPPTQELVAKDLHGNEWLFRHIFRDNF